MDTTLLLQIARIPRRGWRAWAAAACCLLFGWAPAVAAVDQIAVVLSEEGGAYSEVAEGLRKTLGQSPRGGPAVNLIPAATFRKEAYPGKGDGPLLIAVGTRAMQAVAQDPPDLPVLNVLVSRSAFEKIASRGGQYADSAKFSAVFLDQPFSRQLDLIRLVLPERKRIGVLLGPESAMAASQLQAAAKPAGFGLVFDKAENEKELLPALKKLLGESDVLLSVPDATIYNRGTIQSVLLTTYRHQTPVIGFSSAYVKAGALAAVYSTPAQIGRQAAEIALHLSPRSGLPPPQMPRYFSVSTNTQVARSLGIPLASEETLSEKLMKQATESAP